MWVWEKIVNRSLVEVGLGKCIPDLILAKARLAIL
jgi:hypothetical protein